MNTQPRAPRSILVDRIVAGVREDVAAREALVSFADIKARSRSSPPPRDALAALLAPGCSVIAELKRAVPYRGEITGWGSPQEWGRFAQQLEDVGVGLLAVQTQPRRFRGSMVDMAVARAATNLPMMCRDIIVDPYQIHEARCYGADIVPLQVELLDHARLVSLLDRIESLGMTALLEVRTPKEADRALGAGASVIGINAWSLASDELYRHVFGRIVPGLPETCVRIAAGGVESSRNVFDYASQGADAVLVGESILTATDPLGSARRLVATGRHPSCPSRKQG
ncbi:indole-3-glycerol-phosphate synthase [Corynebacterium lizhenjunii]|uniref:indole-3-glycerol-phosphate synthase n=1 Tax=Corynebacterium lizhenjunii TaxID=2709394 RepID=A0A7T0KDP0_9CORY|nr:indole-3-glycerol phosphate synthase TrpC [Corynebacterium lizhenjunii]QPK78461.1 indole-3-glycerol-phosphate synthase [Corynebacterium lizhenjunii]